MSTVEPVRGPVDVSVLGPTLMHEHVFVMQPEALQNYLHVWGESYWDEDVRVADAVEKLRAVRAAGIETIVDATAPGLGRFIPRLRTIYRTFSLPQRGRDRRVVRPRYAKGSATPARR